MGVRETILPVKVGRLSDLMVRLQTGVDCARRDRDADLNGPSALYHNGRMAAYEHALRLFRDMIDRRG